MPKYEVEISSPMFTLMGNGELSYCAGNGYITVEANDEQDAEDKVNEMIMNWEAETIATNADLVEE